MPCIVSGNLLAVIRYQRFVSLSLRYSPLSELWMLRDYALAKLSSCQSFLQWNALVLFEQHFGLPNSEIINRTNIVSKLVRSI